MLLVLGAFLPRLVSAQACDQAKQRIYRITETEVAEVADSLETVLDLIAFVRECEEGEVSLELEFRLLINEVFSLDGLERYEEATARVDHFIDNYFDRASDYYRARFYNWRPHLSALDGAESTMIRDYTQAQKYADALDPINRAHLILNGAHAYIRIAEYETALLLTQQAQALIGTPQTYEERQTVARALLLDAESHDSVERSLRQRRTSPVRSVFTAY